jgi:hypothetical protein
MHSLMSRLTPLCAFWPQLKVSEDLMSVSWGTKRCDTLALVDVKMGRQTKVFQSSSNLSASQEDKCFSLVFKDRTLDLEILAALAPTTPLGRAGAPAFLARSSSSSALLSPASASSASSASSSAAPAPPASRDDCVRAFQYLHDYMRRMVWLFFFLLLFDNMSDLMRCKLAVG